MNIEARLSDLALLPDDRDQLLDMLGESLTQVPQTSTRGEVDHLIAKLLSLPVSAGGASVLCEAATNVAGVYSGAYPDPVDFLFCAGSRGYIEGDRVIAKDGETTVSTIGTESVGYVNTLSVTPDGVRRVHRGDWDDVMKKGYDSVLAGRTGYPLVGLPTSDQKTGGSFPNAVYTASTTEAKIDLAMYSGYGAIATATAVEFNVTTRVKVNEGVQWYANVFQLDSEFPVFMAHDLDNSVLDMWYGSISGDPSKKGTIAYMTPDNGVTVECASSGSYDGYGVALLHETTTKNVHMVKSDKNGNVVGSQLLSGSALPIVPNNISVALDISGTTAMIIAMDNIEWQKGLNGRDNDDVGVILWYDLTDNSQTSKKIFTRSDIDPKGIYAPPFAVGMPQNLNVTDKVAGNVVLGLPRLDGSGVDYVVINASTQPNAVSSSVVVMHGVYPQLTALVRKHPHGVMRCMQGSQGLGLMYMDEVGTGQGYARAILGAQTTNGSSSYSNMQHPDSSHAIATVNAEPCYVNNPNLVQPNEPSKIPSLSDSPMSKLYFTGVSCAVYVDWMPVALPTTAEEGTMILLLRDRESYRNARSYYSDQAQQLSTPVVEWNPTTNQTVLNKCLGYVALTDDHPLYAGAAVCIKTASGWEVTNLI
ncbi:hypothetical protein [Vibrio phage V-YDF132]|nr:hypothetical protein [Vibrio phage V-YDF132]